MYSFVRPRFAVFRTEKSKPFAFRTIFTRTRNGYLPANVHYWLARQSSYPEALKSGIPGFLRIPVAQGARICIASPAVRLCVSSPLVNVYVPSNYSRRPTLRVPVPLLYIYIVRNPDGARYGLEQRFIFATISRTVLSARKLGTDRELCGRRTPGI